MAEFKTKLMTLAGVATLFAGMAHAQVTGCTFQTNANFVAAEGTHEQLSDSTITCAAVPGASTINLTVYLSPAVSITSATVGSGGSARSEAMAGQTASFTAGGGTATDVVAGTVSGSSVSFNGIQIAANTAINITITNIKIDATQIAASTGAPTPVTETVFLGGTNVAPTVLGGTGSNVAFASNALSGVTTLKTDGTAGTPASVQICSGVTAFDVTKPAFIVQFAEGFPAAFKVKGTAAGNAALGSEFTNGTYTGYGVTASTGNTATSGTRVQLSFAGLPAGVNYYLPIAISNSGGTMTAVTSVTGAFSQANPTTANGSPSAPDNKSAPTSTNYMALSVAADGTATAIYEETTPATSAVETYSVPVYEQAGGAAVAAPADQVAVTVGLGPVGATSNVPNFVAGSSTVTKKGNAFSACSTTLLFPFVTNQLGFDTGLAISNTSSDLLDSGTKSKAAKQNGTCTLTFFGDTAPAAVTTGTINAGTVYAAAASVVAPGFQGYMIASCNFLYGHGFAYVVYNLLANNGAAMGYLADAITSDRKSQITTGSVTSTVTGGVLTGVSGSVTTTTVGSTSPEQ